MALKLILVSIFIFFLNIPFGYWRAHVAKFSINWIAAIHLPVIVIIAMRYLIGIGNHWSSYLLFVSAFFIGQQIGIRIYRKNKKKLDDITACLFADLKRMNPTFCHRKP